MQWWEVVGVKWVLDVCVPSVWRGGTRWNLHSVGSAQPRKPRGISGPQITVPLLIIISTGISSLPSPFQGLWAVGHVKLG